MNNADKPMTKEQEEAMKDICIEIGFLKCYSTVLNYLEENLGKQNKTTINVRLLLNPSRDELNYKKQKSVEKSGIVDLMFERTDELLKQLETTQD